MDFMTLAGSPTAATEAAADTGAAAEAAASTTALWDPEAEPWSVGEMERGGTTPA